MKRALVLLALLAPSGVLAEPIHIRGDAPEFVTSDISLETGAVTLEPGVTVDVGARQNWRAVEMIGGVERLVPQERVYLQYTDSANWVRVVIGTPGEYGPRVERAGTGYGFRFSDLDSTAPRVRRKGD